jgi:hypothetical protein
MNDNRLLGTKELAESPVVANCCMNRERNLLGSNGNDVELGFDPRGMAAKPISQQTIVR